VLRTKLLPAFEMSEPKLDRFVQEIRAMRPKMLFRLSVVAELDRTAR